MLLTALIAASVLVLDLASKQLVMSRLAEGETVTVIPHLLTFVHVRNPGAAYGLLSGGRWFLAAVALVMVIVAFYVAPKLERPWERVGLGLMAGGAVGNLIDRVRWGLVTDFIHLEPLPIFQVFNVADIAITFSVVAVGASWLLTRSEEGPDQP